jgi:hypothetical protein
MIEVLKQALEALEKSKAALAEELSAWDFDSSSHHIQESHDLCGPAITSIKKAIREHAMYEVQRLGQEIEQEPMVYCEIHHLPEPCVQCAKEHEGYNTHPPQRTWVGLTDAEIDAEADKEEQAYGFIQGVAWAEAKLKEKNSA